MKMAGVDRDLRRRFNLVTMRQKAAVWCRKPMDLRPPTAHVIQNGPLNTFRYQVHDYRLSIRISLNQG